MRLETDKTPVCFVFFAAVRVGFNQSSYEVEEGQFINVCVAVLEPQGETEPEILIELNIDFLSNPASGMLYSSSTYNLHYCQCNYVANAFYFYQMGSTEYNIHHKIFLENSFFTWDFKLGVFK